MNELKSLSPKISRGVNLDRALSFIRRRPGASQGEIRESLGLSKVTIAELTKELAGLGLIRSVGSKRSSGVAGRRAECFNVDPDAGYVIAVRLGRDSSAALVNFEEKIVSRRNFQLPYDDFQTAITKDVPRMVKKMIKEGEMTPDKILRLCLLFEGAVDSIRGVSVHFARFGISDYPVAAVLEKKTGMKVRVNSIVRTKAFAERLYGEEKFDNLIYLGVDAGLGGAVMMGGRIIDGANSMCGEIGHVQMEPDGPKCLCGRKGCLQMMISEQGIKARVAAKAEKGVKFRFDPEKLTMDDVSMALKGGDAVLNGIIADGAETLARTVVFLVNGFDPEAVFFGGRVIDHIGDWIVPRIEKAVMERTFFPAGRKITIRKSRITDDEVLTAAAADFYRNDFNLRELMEIITKKCG